MPIPYKIGTQEVQVAASARELTVDQLIKLDELKDKSDICAILAILSNTEKQLWFDIDLSLVDMERLDAATAWIGDDLGGALLSDMPAPDKVVIAEREVVVPKNLEIKTLGQSMMFKQLVYPHVIVDDDKIKGLKPVGVAMALAIYLQPEFTKEKFDGDSIELMVEACKELKAVEAVPLAAFFLKKFLNSENGKRSLSIQRTSNSRQQASTSSDSSGK